MFAASQGTLSPPEDLSPIAGKKFVVLIHSRDDIETHSSLLWKGCLDFF